jgi:hypothetical protein
VSAAALRLYALQEADADPFTISPAPFRFVLAAGIAERCGCRRHPTIHSAVVV